ncbi:MAG: type IX secretion system membrane protein PorP/SprF [Saprospiraceae bacterium]|nr:type IX secretion system membrane protein PorP/SprF [Saprospiraceae bacterium]
MINYKNLRLLSSLIAFCFLQNLHAQQLPQYTQFSINPYHINPGVAGTEDFIYLQAGHRSQWSDFEGAPKTTYFSGHTTLNQQSIRYRQRRKVTGSRVALGLLLSKDQTGPLEQSAGALTFAYNFPLTQNNLRLSFGLNAGLKRFTYDPEGHTDNLLHTNDPAVQQLISKSLLNFSAGFWLYDDQFFAGLSSFQLFNTAQSDPNFGLELTAGDVFLRHYNAMLGYKLEMGADAHLVPSVLVKAVQGAPISYDINAKLVFSDQYWLGGSYRKEDSFAFFGGLLINQRLEMTYSFDLVLSKIRNAAAGSNEIHLAYRLFHSGNVICPSKFW